jgi:hypothetical protein
MGHATPSHPAQLRYAAMPPADRLAAYRAALPDERFWAKVTPSAAGCLLWDGAQIKGYGSMRRGGLHIYAHRYTYVYLIGLLPEGLDTLDHVVCETPLCVDPTHTVPTTRGKNRARGPISGMAAINAAKTRCPAGHLFNEANTYIAPNGQRQCRICSAHHKREYQRRVQARRSGVVQQ